LNGLKSEKDKAFRDPLGLCFTKIALLRASIPRVERISTAR
jgi:hypothetical protein